jgi:hypothetical protein
MAAVAGADVEVQAIAGTATAVITGKPSDQVTNPVAVAEGSGDFGLCVLAVVTVAGTVAFQARAAAVGNTIKAATLINALPGATGGVATRVA